MRMIGLQDEVSAPENDQALSEINISVIIPVSERYDDARHLYQSYKDAVDALGGEYEFVYVLDGDYPELFEQLKLLQAQGEAIKIIKFAKWFGEATALTAGFEHSTGDIIITLPAYYQVEPEEIRKLVGALESHDMVIGRRWPRTDFWLNRLQARVFHLLLKLMTGSPLRDLGCGVRIFKRKVIQEILLYGDQHRFLPELASRRGFQVREIDLRQSPLDPYRRIYRPGVYLRRLLDIVTVLFLLRFTKKPLRFFGLIGTALFAGGGICLLSLVAERLFFGAPLAGRPSLLLSSLLIVLGAQIFSLGLIGELIIFTHAKELKEYTIERIIN